MLPARATPRPLRHTGRGGRSFIDGDQFRPPQSAEKFEHRVSRYTEHLSRYPSPIGLNDVWAARPSGIDHEKFVQPPPRLISARERATEIDKTTEVDITRPSSSRRQYRIARPRLPARQSSVMAAPREPSSRARKAAAFTTAVVLSEQSSAAVIRHLVLWASRSGPHGRPSVRASATQLIRCSMPPRTWWGHHLQCLQTDDCQGYHRCATAF